MLHFWVSFFMARPSLTTCHVLHDLCHLVRFELDLPSQKAHWSLRHELCASSSRFQPGRRMGSTCFLNFGMLGIDCIPLMGCFETHHSQGSHLQSELTYNPFTPQPVAHLTRHATWNALHWTSFWREIFDPKVVAEIFGSFFCFLRFLVGGWSLGGSKTKQRALSTSTFSPAKSTVWCEKPTRTSQSQIMRHSRCMITWQIWCWLLEVLEWIK